MDTNTGQGKSGRLEQLEEDILRMDRESEDPRFSAYLKDIHGKLLAQRYQADLLRADLDRNYKIYEEQMRNREQVQVQRESTYFEQPDLLTPAVWEVSDNPNASYGQSGSYVYQAVPVSASEVKGSPAPAVRRERKQNMEFVIGAVLLGVIGGGFILTALVMLGMNYMSGMVKGLSLYGACLVVLLLSELLLYRRVPKLGIILSSVALSGVYITTAVNLLSLQILNMWAAFGITLVMSIVVILLSRRRNSLIYRVIGILAAYLSFLMLQDGMSGVEFSVISAMLLLVNVLFIAFPVKVRQTAMRVLHMAANGIFTIFFVWRAQICGVEDEVVLIYEIASLIILHALFVMEICRRQKEQAAAGKEGRSAGKNTAILTVYCISSVIQLFDIGTLIYALFPSGRVLNTPSKAGWVEVQSALAGTCAHAAMLGILVICVVSFFILMRRKCKERWFVYYFLNAAACAVYAWATGTLCYVVLVVMMVVAKLLSFRRIREVRICDAMITAFVGITLALDPQPAVLLVGIAVGILCLAQWKTYHEIVMTAALVLYAAPKLPANIQLPAAMGLLFVGILIFNNVKRWRDEYVLVFNILALTGQAVCLLLLWNPVYRNAYITYLCMLIFGMATIVLTFQEKYHMPVKGKNLILAVFLTYMAIIFRVNEPIVNSILLMVIALVCVGIGFAERQKATRIYGLVLSLIVCGKIVLYDFLENPVLQRTILFFAVGVIALIIAGIYIILEKKASQ